jgi:hypothetical protein
MDNTEASKNKELQEQEHMEEEEEVDETTVEVTESNVADLESQIKQLRKDNQFAKAIELSSAVLEYK